MSLATEDLERLWRVLEGQDPAVVRDALLEAVPALVDRWGQVSAVAAADWYEELRSREEGLPLWRPPIPEGIGTEHVRTTVRRLAGGLWGSEPAGVLRSLATNLEYWCKDRARYMAAAAVDQDPARPGWARVPRGPSTCGWCLMLASRGWAYTRGAKAAAASHRGCDCQIVPKFGKDAPHIRGYDPDALRRQYEQARAAVIGREGEGHTVTASDITSELRRTDGRPVGAWPGGVPQRTGGVRPYASLATTPRIQGDTSFAAQVGQVNPYRWEPTQWPDVWDPDGEDESARSPYRVNCARCVHALLLRHLGYDVQAGAGSYKPVDGARGNTAEALTRWSGPDGRPVMLRGFRDDRRTLEWMREHLPTGSFGIMRVTFARGRGHTWVWEQTSDGLVFWDGQSGRRATQMDYTQVKAGSLAFARLDNAVPADDVLDVVSIPEPERRKS